MSACAMKAHGRGGGGVGGGAGGGGRFSYVSIFNSVLGLSSSDSSIP